MCEEKEGRGGEWEGSGLECLSASALQPSAETGTLWEQACSGVFYVQCVEGELRGQVACKIKHKWCFGVLFTTIQSIDMVQPSFNGLCSFLALSRAAP